MELQWIIVQSGDTLSRVASAHHMTRELLAALNPEAAAQPYLLAGQMLRILPGTGRRYAVQPGESVGLIAERFDLNEEELREANPEFANVADWSGRCIHIPDSNGKTIVRLQGEYGYRQMNRDIVKLVKQYPFITTGSIGTSVMGKSLPYLKIGEGARHIHVNASVHANEWLTTAVVMRFIEDYAKAYSVRAPWHQFQTERWMRETTLWIVPMVNPDGVELVQEGVVNEHPHAKQLLAWNAGRTHFTHWKANIRGVDLNDQFPAHWEEEAARRGITSPGPRDYAGTAPLSEPEAWALAQWTEHHSFAAVVSLHSQGQEIYWNYRDLEPKESAPLSRRLARASGYKAVKLGGSDAGYKDWFIQQFRKPGFTVEVGLGVNPLPVEQFDDICVEVGMLLAELLSDGDAGTESK
ncbi:M14 family metallopeptidase [Paenibacillus xylanilyticus]|uniref:M14 family metallopeptidase n=1 Tax=Paenibacillus xylanilyticus TaxID=248903 RepID=UPI0039A26783